MDSQDKKQEDKVSELEVRMRQWRQANPRATLTEIEDAVDAEMSQLRRQLLGELAGIEGEEEPESCPQCGEKLVGNGRKKRKLRTKDNEVIELERKQLRCLACGMTLFPPG